MPNFVLNRTMPLQGHGHSINFTKGEPCWVPTALIPAAIAIGAECIDEEVSALPPEVAPEVELTVDERETLLIAAFDQMVARTGQSDEYREDFNGQGLPNVKALEKITGFLPTAKERTTEWQKYREAKGL